MKYKTTKKAVMNGYKTVISIGYCDLQNALDCLNPIAFTSRAEGWAADIYDIEGIAIVTGYAPFGNVKPSYSTVRSYNNEAEETRSRTDWSVQRDLMTKLMIRFIEEVTA